MKTCISNGTKIQDFLCKSEDYVDDQRILSQDQISVALANLRAKSLDLFSDNDLKHSLGTQKLNEWIAEAKSLDDRLAEWADTIDEEWKYSHLPPTVNPGSAHTFSPSAESVHSYKTHAHARVWNIHRAGRVMANSIRVRCLLELSPPTSRSPGIAGELEQCQLNIDYLVKELCDSAQFFFDYSIETRKGFEELSQERRLTFSDSEIVPKVAALLAWPLGVMVSTKYVKSSQRECLKHILATVADSLHDADIRLLLEQDLMRF